MPQLSSTVIDAFTSRFFNAAQVAERLGPLANATDRVPSEVLARGQAVGAAVRATAPERIPGAMRAWASEVVDWTRVRARDGGALRGHLGAIMTSKDPGRHTLCVTSFNDFECLFGRLAGYEGTIAPGMGLDLLAWLELGDEAALARLPAPSGYESIDAHACHAARVYRTLTASFGQDVGKELAWLANSSGHYGLITVGVPLLAARLGIDPTGLSCGATCDLGGRDDLHTEEHKPLVELLSRLPEHHDLLRAILADRVQNAWFKKPLLPDMFDAVPWDDRVDRSPEGSVRRWGTLVFSQKGGRAAVKVCASEKAARSDFDKKAQALPPASEPTRNALAEALADGSRPEVKRLLSLGAPWPGERSRDWWRDPVLVDVVVAHEPDKAALLDEVCHPFNVSHFVALAAEKILRAGAPWKPVRGAGPLHVAAATGQTALVELLLAHGFDPTVVGEAGMHGPAGTPLDLARAHEDVATIVVLERALGKATA